MEDFNNTQIKIEIDNLERELDYYLIYEPKNEAAIVEIENKLDKLKNQITE